jgi:hypothetical protein
VATLYDDDGKRASGSHRLKPMVAQVLKISSWQASPRRGEKQYYAMKVKVFSSAGTSSQNILTVNINSQPRGSPSAGEWVGIKHSVASRQPIMIPKVTHSSAHNVVLSAHLFDVCVVPND